MVEVGEEPLGYVKQITVNKKSPVVQLFFKANLESKFEVMFLNLIERKGHLLQMTRSKPRLLEVVFHM